jgi:uncharacterized membrane protein
MAGMIASLIPTPLHPAVVHLPMALAVLAPVFAVGALAAVRRGVPPLRRWSLAVAMFMALSVSAWVSIETGEDEEDRVERVVPEAALETHEDAADAFLWLSVAVLGVAAVGLRKGRIGMSARYAATAASVVLLVAGYRVGHSGGALVYTHGAASAYVDGSGPTPGAPDDENDKKDRR